MEVASEDHSFKRVGGNGRKRTGAIASGRGMTKRPSSFRGQQVPVTDQHLSTGLEICTQSTKTLVDQLLLMNR